MSDTCWPNCMLWKVVESWKFTKKIMQKKLVITDSILENWLQEFNLQETHYCFCKSYVQKDKHFLAPNDPLWVFWLCPGGGRRGLQPGFYYSCRRTNFTGLLGFEARKCMMQGVESKKLEPLQPPFTKIVHRVGSQTKLIFWERRPLWELSIHRS